MLGNLNRQHARDCSQAPDNSDFPSIKGGLPHSEIHGSKLIRSSPRLFAAYHVLHRLCMPRHPPNALTTLNRSHCQCSSLVGSGKPCHSLAREGCQTWTYGHLNGAAPVSRQSGYLLQPDLSDAIDVFDPRPHQDVTPSDIKGADLKTSFSR
jgi:hypothetical protein